MNKWLFMIFQYNLRRLVPELKFIDIYNRQYDDFSKDREILLPSALIEIRPYNLNKMGQYVLQAEVDINIHLCNEQYQGSEEGDYDQEGALDSMYLADKVMKLHGMSFRDQTLKDPNNIYFPLTGTTLSGITYDYGKYMIGPVNVTNCSIIPVKENNINISIVGFKCIITSTYIMPNYINLSGVQTVITGITYFTP